MTRTLITGVAGFTGRYLAEALVHKGHEVHGIVHHQADEVAPGVATIYRADLADFAAMAAIVDQVKPTHVVHLAAISFVAHDDVSDLYRSNVVGTRQLLHALARLPDRPKSVIVCSSANVYGNSQEGILDESVPLAPANDYGVSKVAVEYLARLYLDKVPVIVVRPFNYTGRGQSTNFVIPKIVEHARTREEIIELGNLDVFRDFSDVRTVVDAYVRLLEEPKAIGQTFNISSGRETSLRDVIEVVETLTAHKFEVRVNPAFVRAKEVHSLCGSAAKLESVIGPIERRSLEETLRWMLED